MTVHGIASKALLVCLLVSAGVVAPVLATAQQTIAPPPVMMLPTPSVPIAPLVSPLPPVSLSPQLQLSPPPSNSLTPNASSPAKSVNPLGENSLGGRWGTPQK